MDGWLGGLLPSFNIDNSWFIIIYKTLKDKETYSSKHNLPFEKPFFELTKHKTLPSLQNKISWTISWL